VTGDGTHSFETLFAGQLSVRLAHDVSEVIASQKLRYRIFCDEMGAHASDIVRQQKRDFDEFDDYCDHLLVIDNEKSGESAVVGTYRLLRRSSMQAIGRFYTETEFDVSALKAQEGEIMELGRSCVDAAYRSRAVMQLLWRGIGSYAALHSVRFMFGCASFNGADAEQHKLGLAFLHHYHLAEESMRLKALPDQYVPMNTMLKEEVDVKAALMALPPLIKGYLRLNGHVSDGAVIDEAFNTTDVGIVVQTSLVTEKYAQRYVPEEID